MPEKKKILLTIDVEDWFQVENLRPWYPQNSWNNQQLRVERNTHKLLDLFDKSKEGTIKATFFVLGWIAEKLPDLAREIHKRGHEVASHGYNHHMCNRLDKNTLVNDLTHSKKLLEDIIGEEIKGYRAPNFSINDATLELIQQAGYQYDSSFNNFSRHGRYGWISINGHQKQGIALQYHNRFHEIPISNLKLAGKVLPWGGGGYFRFIPFLIFKAGIQNILKKNDAYMFYMHPWEIDPEQPRVDEVSGLSRWRHYLNLEKTQLRLAKLIEAYRHCNYVTCSQYLEKVKN